MAFVTRGVTIFMEDERTDRQMTFYFEGGITSFVRYLNRNREVLHPVVHVEKEVDGITMEAAIQYTDAYAESVYAFANTINTIDGGTHLTGLRAAVTRMINDYARRSGLLKDNDPNFTGDDTREGLTAIISIKHPDPQFESQTKVKLMNPEVQTLTQQIVGEAFGTFLEENPSAGKAIVAKCLTSARARDAARKARDLVIRKSALESLTLPGKLADCSRARPAIRPSFTSSKVTRPAAAPSRAATGTFRPSCRCAARSSTPNAPGWIKSWRTTKSRRSFRPWAPALAITSICPGCATGG